MADLDAEIESMLVPLLGKLTGSRALALAKDKAAIKGPTTRADLEAICGALLPMLRPLAGARAAQSVLERISEL